MPELSWQDVAWFWRQHAGGILVLIMMLSVSCVTFRICAWRWSKPSAPPPGALVHPERAARVRLRSPLWWLLDLPAFGVVGAMTVLSVWHLILDLIKGKPDPSGIFSLMLLTFFVSAFSYVIAFGRYFPHRPLSPEERKAIKQEWQEMLARMDQYNAEQRKKDWERTRKRLAAINNPFDMRSPFYEPMSRRHR
ncbi:hypothetical protein [Nitrospira calida]|jgi:hypothetical protein